MIAEITIHSIVEIKRLSERGESSRAQEILDNLHAIESALEKDTQSLRAKINKTKDLLKKLNPNIDFKELRNTVGG
jgi:hypothetical protein